MTRRLLVVCTANVCRSPVAAALLARALHGRRDVDGHDWAVSSAGTGEYRAELDSGTVKAAAAVGVDLSTHRSRVVDREVLAVDGADLVITMARAHLPVVVGLDPAAWSRTFTLKDLARRANELPPPSETEGFGGWLTRMGAGRQARDMLKPDPADDVDDPYGLPLRHHEAMIAEVAHEIDNLVRWGPWAARPDAD